MKKLVIGLIFGTFIGGMGWADEVYTEPVGCVSVDTLANSDTFVSIPLHRAPEYLGQVSSVSGNLITVQGNPAWTTNQFVFNAGTQNSTYYALIASGAKEGMYYTITANGNNTVTLDLAGDNISGDVVNGTVIKVIPYRTLATLFPSQSGITSTSSVDGSGTGFTRVLVPDQTTAGINLPPARSYYYYNGAANGGPGWRLLGEASTIRDHDVLLPDSYVIVRQEGASASSIKILGAVPTTDMVVAVGTVQANTAQDNFLGSCFPVPMTLAESGLYQSGAFAGTNRITGVGGDKLLVFDNTLSALNKVASKVYYYYTGSSFGGPGWRQAGVGMTQIKDNEAVFQPSCAYIIRKNAQTSPATVLWRQSPAYLDNL